jgi:hypothetical protein
VVGVFRHDHLRQQDGGRDALADHRRWHQCLHSLRQATQHHFPRTWRSTVNTPGWKYSFSLMSSPTRFHRLATAAGVLWGL